MPDVPIHYSLKQKQQPGPNCLWTVNRPDIGMVGEGYIFEVLANNIKRWRTANGWPIGLTFDEDLEQLLCAQHPDLCQTDDPRAPIQARALRYSDVLVGTEVMARFYFSGRAVVSQEEAERRAAICAGCRLNVLFTKGCGGVLCGRLLEVVKAIVGGKGTTKDEQLHSCYICGCFLSAAVWLPLETQVPPMSDYQKAQFENVPHCWKKASLMQAASHPQ